MHFAVHYSKAVNYFLHDPNSVQSLLLNRRQTAKSDNKIRIDKCSIDDGIRNSKLNTVYRARHTGDDVVIIFSARLGLLMQKYLTVPS